jgi:hypothetical protein
MEEENTILKKKVEKENELKELIVNHVGENYDPENGEVTVEMIVEVFARDFPEFLFVIAQENFLRGYQQAFIDIEAHEKMKDEEDPV